jgi:polyhydroxyalkanoate synthesis regulator phasin
MAQNPMKSAIDASKDVTQKAQDRLEALLREFAKTTEEQSAQMQQAVQDLRQRSRDNSERVAELVDRQIKSQLSALGIATKADIKRLEKKIDTLQKAGPQSTKGSAAKKPAAKKSAAKKSAAKKSASA